MSPGDVLLLGGAGLAAGAVNAVAGGGTLISFPALLAVGMSPVTANITSSIGLLSGYLGGSVAYRRELTGQSQRVRVLLPAAVVGAAVGAVLLLLTPDATFRALVPYLVLTSCALLALQPRLARVVADRRSGRTDLPWAAVAGVGLAAVYGSYFGAGLGVLLLAVLGILVADELQRLNALKGLLSLLINIAGVVVFVLATDVAWSFVAVLAVSAYLGGAAGVSVARHLPAVVLRACVVVLGTVVGLVLLITR